MQIEFLVQVIGLVSMTAPWDAIQSRVSTAIEGLGSGARSRRDPSPMNSCSEACSRQL